ncbi:MAG TPA: proton-conducting transporter membrane subunit, partial [Candidatus Binatia bacterium]|nr:proton-conducting transporter membrane subunit [Candidatus Binatia bacterium]
MSVLPFLVIAFGFAAASLLLRRWPPASAGVGLVGLVASLIAALTIRPDELAIAGGSIAGSEYARLFLLLGTWTGLGLVAIGLATTLPRNLAGALLAGLGAAGLALSLPDPTTAVIAAIAGGLAGILVTLREKPTTDGVAVATRELRAIAVAGALILLATAWVARPLDVLAVDPGVFGLAYVAVAIGVAMRFGAIPFHLWAARVADAAPEVALPLLSAWGPAALAVVGLAWVDSSIVPVVPVSGDLPVERAVVIAIGLACLILGAIAAWIQDDLEHVVGYATVQDAGIVILAFAALDPGVWSASRTWIIVLLAARTAFAAWAVVVRARFGTRHIDDLDGWARRSPVLGIALLGIAVASVGWPGLAAFDARANVIELALDGPIQALALVAVFLPLLYYGRLFVVGLARPGEAMLAIQDDRPRRAEVASALARGATPDLGLSDAPTPRSRRAAPAALGGVGPAIAANRPLLVGILSLVLAGTAVITAAGGFGLPAAAAEPPPGSAGQPSDVTGPGESPSATPVPTPSPTPNATPSEGPTPTASPSATTARSLE